MIRSELTERKLSGRWFDWGSLLVFGGFWALLFFGTFFVAGPWAGFHSMLLGGAGLLMLLRPPVVSLPRLWWGLAATFVIAGTAAFLPAGWFAMPEWRQQLRALGVETGPLVAIQARQAAEAFALFALMLFTGLWLAGHRASPTQVRLWALAFTLGVAGYAIFSKVMQNSLYVDQTVGKGVFGFFPNRNHTATYLAMGAICGLGNVIQAIRDRRFLTMDVALVATAVCLWAVVGWSISRAGVLLVVIGGLAWAPMLRRRYLGWNGLLALGLIGLTVAGIFFFADSEVKARLSKTVEKVTSAISSTAAPTPGEGKPAIEPPQGLDFRILTALDTLDLIRDFKWTGIGAGQFYYVFPQYRRLGALTDANDQDHYHPESDWLWMAAEAGVPATLALAALVILAFGKSLIGILGGRDRALRSACLVAAMLVPVHGLFDVPGHRITLAWSAAFLFGLSLHAPSTDQKLPPLRVWPFRLAALPLLAAAGFLVRAQWWGGPQPALTAAKAALNEAHRLYREDQALQPISLVLGQTPDPAEDRLEKALAILNQTTPIAPLDREILRYKCFLAFHFDDKYELIDHSFAIERALDPTWVAGPLLQAEAWARIDPQRTAALWNEALRRAERLDRLQPGSRRSTERTRQRIRGLAKGKPELENLLPKAEESGK